jgi:hypothetical protein
VYIVRLSRYPGKPTNASSEERSCHGLGNLTGGRQLTLDLPPIGRGKRTMSANVLLSQNLAAMGNAVGLSSR